MNQYFVKLTGEVEAPNHEEAACAYQRDIAYIYPFQPGWIYLVTDRATGEEWEVSPTPLPKRATSETYDEITVETILCVWEAMLEERDWHTRYMKGQIKTKPDAWNVTFNDFWDGESVVDMRSRARDIGVWCENVFKAAGSPEGMIVSWVWEIVPALLRVWDFGGHGLTAPDVADGVAKMAELVRKSEESHRPTWHIAMREYARQEFADDGTVFDEDQMDKLRKDGMDPREAVEHVADKYGLIRVAMAFR